jgi:disulfide bond formation protein DsbB
VAGVVSWRRIHWTAVASVLLFSALNAAFGIYVLNTFRDARWSSGEPPLTAPSLSGTPLVGQFLAPLDSTLNAVVGQANDFLAFKQALPVALEFLAASGWALLVSFPVAILAAVISFRRARRRAADFAEYRASVDLLTRELEQVKRQISSGT